jgi:hypothetical protein
MVLIAHSGSWPRDVVAAFDKFSIECGRPLLFSMPSPYAKDD